MKIVHSNYSIICAVVYIYPWCSLIANVRWSAVSGCYFLLVWRTLMHLDISQEFELVVILLLIDLQ